MRSVLLLAFLLVSVSAYAGVPEDRLMSFQKSASIAGKIDAYTDACPVDEGQEKPRHYVDQLINGFRQEDETAEQVELIRKAALDSYNQQKDELAKKTELNCKLSDFIWEKQALMEDFLMHLKAIMASREKSLKRAQDKI